jgi:hypothetical protein
MEIDIDYMRGLKQLHALLPPDNPSIRDQFLSLDARFSTHLEEGQYGHDDTYRTEHNRIIDALNKFMDKQLHLSISFIDLCASNYVSSHTLDELLTEPSPPLDRYQLTPWQNGDQLSIQGQVYGIDGPVQKQWLDQRGALYLQAPGRHEQTGQKVWLKQCQVSRAHNATLTLKKDLAKEGRLLLKLQQEGQRDFPRYLGSEDTRHSTTLVYEILAGRSLATTFDSAPKPLDLQATKRLLAGRHTLLQMLHTLHTRMNCAHRMLTPETLLLQIHSNRIVLSDVGLAASTVQRGEGPQFYQAPEQLSGLPVPDRATDIYQLGALFYHLLTGQHITEPATDQASGLEPELEMLLRKAAAPIPRDRWPNVHTFSQALRQLGY